MAKKHIALCLLSFAVTAQPQSRHWRETADETIWTGRYGNCDHGFFVLLPPGVLGHGTKSPNPNHGFNVNMLAPGSDQALWDQNHHIL